MFRSHQAQQVIYSLRTKMDLSFNLWTDCAPMAQILSVALDQ